MRRLAALYDIHANLPALEAVLEDVRRLEVDELVIGGDVVPGPMPSETIALLLDLQMPVRFIHGNGDREVVACRRGGESRSVPERFERPFAGRPGNSMTRRNSSWPAWPSALRVDVQGLGKCSSVMRPRRTIRTSSRGSPP